MKIHDLEDIKEKHIYLEPDKNGRSIWIYTITNSIATESKYKSTSNLFYPDVLLYSDNMLYRPIKEKTMSLDIKTSDNADYTYKPTLYVEENPVFFFIYNTDNYFHFLYDTVPYLISFFHMKKSIHSLKLLITYPNTHMTKLYTFVLELLSILNISQNDLIYVNKDTTYKNIYISTSFTHDKYSTLSPREEIYVFFNDIVKRCNKCITSRINYPKYIYVSRRSWIHNDFSNIGTNYTLRRKCINEDELVTKLKERGFIEVFTENMSMADKVLMFNNAEIIIGSIGGGISNAVFSTKKTRLIAIVSPLFMSINDRFKYSLQPADTIYFYDTKHQEQTKFKKYMRVSCMSKNIVGEIEDVYNDSLLILYSDMNTTGWNASIKYKQIVLNNEDVDILDNGLNSAWVCDIDNLLRLI